MKPTKKKVNVKTLNLVGQIGYGIDGNLTRQEWQKECLDMFLSGRDKFNNWQTYLSQQDGGKLDLDLIRYADSNPFKDEVSFPDSSKPPIELTYLDCSPRFVVDLSNCVFEQAPIFNLGGYKFLTGVSFNGATFEGLAVFGNSFFLHGAYFIGATFSAGANFKDARFLNSVHFEHSFFHHSTFYGSEFSGHTNFDCVIFQYEADFEKASFNNYAHFDGAIFGEKANFSGNNNDDSKLQSFGRISFLGAHFRGQVDFSNREFKGSTNFGKCSGQPTRFDMVPLFHNCKLHQDTTFWDAKFPLQLKPDESACRAYNTLRHAMSQQQSSREEQRFLKFELEAERLLAKKGVRQLYWIYKQVADYGFSVWRPMLLFVLMPMLFAGACYGGLAGSATCVPLLSNNCQFDSGLTIQTLEFTFLQGLPPLGIEKISDSLRNALFDRLTPLSNLALASLVVMQKILALSGWFFVALALRNLFKMK